MPPPSNPDCGNCRYSRDPITPDRGPPLTHCHRFPPAAGPASFDIEADGHAGPYGFPTVPAAGWCGEYQP